MIQIDVKKCVILSVVFLFLMGLFYCSVQQNILPNLKGSYLGQKPPGVTPEVFAPGIVSTNNHAEMGCAWTPEGKEFYFGRSETADIGSNWAIWMMREKDNI